MKTQFNVPIFSTSASFLISACFFVLVGGAKAQGPLAWWKFDEASGSVAVDSSENGHDGELIGDAVFEPAGGRFGGAVSLDGDGDLVEIPHDDSLGFPQGQDFSITVFFNGPDTNTNDGLVSKGYGDNPRSPDGYYLLMVTDPGMFEFDSRCCAGATPRARTGQVGPTLSDGEWHNVTLVRDYAAGPTGEIRSYVDGMLVHTISMNAADGGDWNMGVNTESIQIGDHLNRFTEGKFDDVALWDLALTEAEIMAIAENGVAVTLDAIARSFRANPPSVLLDEPTTLEWRVKPGATVEIDEGVGDVTDMTDAEGVGSVEVTPSATTTYTLTAEDGGVSEELQTTVTTSLLGSFGADLGSVTPGQAVVLSWTVSPSASVAIDQGVGEVDDETTDGIGSIVINPTESAVYTLTASAGGNEETAEVTVNVVSSTDGPVAYWPFDEDGGTIAADLSGSSNEHPAELMGGVEFVPAGGLFGGAVEFDGASGEVRSADHEDFEFEQGQDFSITLFYNGPDTNTNDGLISKGYGDNPRSPDGYYLLMVTDNGSYEFDSRCCAGGTPRARTGTAGPSIADEEWHNVTLVRDYGAGEIRSYIDGELTSTIVLNPNDGGDWNMGVNDEDLVIGDHLERFTTGLIDEVAIWRRVLSEGEIAEIASNGVGGAINRQKLRFIVEGSGPDMLTLRWESKSGKLYNVRSETDPIPEPVSWPIFDDSQDIVATPPENTLQITRPADATRFFVIEEFDAPPVSIFADDFESGQGAWTTGSDGLAGTAWELGAPENPGPASANSPTNCFGTNLADNYAFDADVWLRSPAIDLTTAGGATLRYSRFYDIEPMFDEGSVMVLDAADDSVLATLEAGIEGLTPDWEAVTRSLPSEALGKEIKIEFRLQADDFNNFAGFYVDDVIVTIP